MSLRLGIGLGIIPARARPTPTTEPVNTVAPSIPSPLTQGQTVPINPGSWTGLPSGAYEYQLQRWNGSSWVDVGSYSSDPDVTFGSADVAAGANGVRPKVRATNVVGPAVAYGAAVTIAAPLTIGGTPPDAVVGSPYSFVPDLAGGHEPYVLSYGGTYPAGITTDADPDVGLAGTPSSSGTAGSLTITVTDADGLTAVLGPFDIAVATGGDQTPDAFTIPAVNGATKGATVTGDPITLTGFDTAIEITVSGSGFQYKINSGSYTSAPGTLNPGDSFTPRMTASSSPSTKLTGTYSVGGVEATWEVLTAADTFLYDQFVGTSASDLFAHAADVGGTWVKNGAVSGGSATIETNRAAIRTGTAAMSGVNAPIADYSVLVNLLPKSNPSSGSFLILLRCSASVLTCYAIGIDYSNGLYACFKIVAGTLTPVGTTSAFPGYTANVATSLAARVTGGATPTIELLAADGETVLATFTDNSSPITTAGRVGIRSTINTTSGAGLQIETITVTTLGPLLPPLTLPLASMARFPLDQVGGLTAGSARVVSGAAVSSGYYTSAMTGDALTLGATPIPAGPQSLSFSVQQTAAGFGNSPRTSPLSAVMNDARRAAADAAGVWFVNPRGIVRSSDDVAITAPIGASGDLHIASNYGGDDWTESVLVAGFNQDDHANGSLLELSDGRVLVMYSRHGSSFSGANYYRILPAGANPSVAANWSSEYTVTGTSNQRPSYTNIFLLDSGHVVTFTRCWPGAEATWAMFVVHEDDLTDGTSWVRTDFTHVDDERGYPILAQDPNDKDRIEFLTQEGHPNEYDTAGTTNAGPQVFHGYLVFTSGVPAAFTNAGTSKSLPIDVTDGTHTPVLSNANGRTWPVDLVVGADGITRFLALQGANAGTRGVILTNLKLIWGKRSAATGGAGTYSTLELLTSQRSLYANENYYIGLAAFDRADPTKILCCEYTGTAYEVKEREVNESAPSSSVIATLTGSTQTNGSKALNYRPFYFENASSGTVRWGWCAMSDYTDYQDYTGQLWVKEG